MNYKTSESIAVLNQIKVKVPISPDNKSELQKLVQNELRLEAPLTRAFRLHAAEDSKGKLKNIEKIYQKYLFHHLIMTTGVNYKYII